MPENANHPRNNTAVCDIVLLTWNKLKTTKKCLQSLTDNTGLPIRIIVIDNGSEDGTREFLLSLKDAPGCQFKIFLNNTNEGWINGINRGLKISEAPYVCITNNDLIFAPGWLEEMTSVFEAHEDVGLMNPNSNNLGAVPHEGQKVEDFARELRARHRTEFVEHPFCIGFCMVVRKDVLDIVGGLSPEFDPIFFDDSDYSLRVHKSGFRLGVSVGSYVWHMEHGSVDQFNERREKIFRTARMPSSENGGRL